MCIFSLHNHWIKAKTIKMCLNFNFSVPCLYAICSTDKLSKLHTLQELRSGRKLNTNLLNLQQGKICCEKLILVCIFASVLCNLKICWNMLLFCLDIEKHSPLVKKIYIFDSIYSAFSLTTVSTSLTHVTWLVKNLGIFLDNFFVRITPNGC